MSEVTLPLGWWLNVEETYCEDCGKMTPCHQYQGHFICNVCGNLTGFWLPILPNNPLNPHNAKDIEGVKKWNNEATALLPVQFKLRK